MVLSKKKATSAVAAIGLAAALALGGTFAWQSISQTALNEASDVVNPGGRLHDDFDGSNKDVYVENFADEPIYARIQLSEYFEIIANYGVEGAEQPTQVLGSKNEDGTYNYDLFYFDGNVGENGTISAGGTNDEGNAYWSWTTGGQTVYMPTFNKNKDSVQAELNGAYVDAVGGISDRDAGQYSGYVEYGVGEAQEGTEIYDADANNVEDENVTEVEATHTAKYTGNATLISMDQWMSDYNSAPGEYWVYDTDGWVYWAQAIEPDSATGLLLDGIELNGVMDDTWYYAINVKAQFITADDLGAVDGTGFYTGNEAPTDDALALLAAIGVDTGEKAEDTGVTIPIKATVDGEDLYVYDEEEDYGYTRPVVQFEEVVFAADTSELSDGVEIAWSVKAGEGLILEGGATGDGGYRLIATSLEYEEYATVTATASDGKSVGTYEVRFIPLDYYADVYVYEIAEDGGYESGQDDKVIEAGDATRYIVRATTHDWDTGLSPELVIEGGIVWKDYNGNVIEDDNPNDGALAITVPTAEGMGDASIWSYTVTAYDGRGILIGSTHFMVYDRAKLSKVGFNAGSDYAFQMFKDSSETFYAFMTDPYLGGLYITNEESNEVAISDALVADPEAFEKANDMVVFK